jgi:hypothetical protein
MAPQQLYGLWERQQWQSQRIDLEREKEHWAGLPDEDMEEPLWGLSSFFVGEERVTTEFHQHGDEYEFFGYTSRQQAGFAYAALSRRLKVIGVGLPVAA